MDVLRLGYLGLESTQVDAWSTFGSEVLGTPVDRDDAGRALLRTDDRPFAIAVEAGDSYDVAYLGWEVRDDAALEDLTARLDKLGTPASPADAEQTASRYVDTLATFDDPFGYTHELYVGPHFLSAPFAPVPPVSGFLGLGHAFLLIPDVRSAEEYFVDGLGLSVSDHIDFKMGASPFEPGPHPVTTSFLNCGPRHHVLALAELPKELPDRGLAHLMLEVASLDDVGYVYDRAQDRGCLTTGFGRHTNDHMVSFYLHGPGGVAIEYGWGGRDVEEEGPVGRYDAPSYWGHRPVQPSPAS